MSLPPQRAERSLADRALPTGADHDFDDPLWSSFSCETAPQARMEALELGLR